MLPLPQKHCKWELALEHKCWARSQWTRSKNRRSVKAQRKIPALYWTDKTLFLFSSTTSMETPFLFHHPPIEPGYSSQPLNSNMVCLSLSPSPPQPVISATFVSPIIGSSSISAVLWLAAQSELVLSGMHNVLWGVEPPSHEELDFNNIKGARE